MLPDAALRVLLALLLAGCALPASALDLDGLMALLGQRQSGAATFHEQRFVQGLDAPLESSGELSFVAPDRLVRRTLKPRAEAMLVEGNTLTFTRSGRSRSVALDATPEMAAMVEAVRGTLTGNAQTLARHFRSRVDGTSERWTLALTPIEPQLAGTVRAVHIGGHGGEVRSVELLLAGGDRSLMRIEPVSGGRIEPAPRAAGAAAASKPAASP